MLLRLFTWVEETIRRHVREGSVSLSALVTAGIGGLVFLGADWVAGETYEGVAEGGGLASLDRPVLDAMIALRSPGVDSAVTHFTDVGGKVGGPIVALVVTLALWALWRTRTPVVLMLIGLAGSTLVTVLGKEATARLRPPRALAVPPYESSPSFPSGHTLNMTVIMALAAYLLLVKTRRVWQQVLALTLTTGMALAMGLSRVYLGHHWLTDVVAGWALALAWVAVVVTLHRVVVTVRRTRSAARAAAEERRGDSPSVSG